MSLNAKSSVPQSVADPLVHENDSGPPELLFHPTPSCASGLAPVLTFDVQPVSVYAELYPPSPTTATRNSPPVPSV